MGENLRKPLASIDSQSILQKLASLIAGYNRNTYQLVIAAQHAPDLRHRGTAGDNSDDRARCKSLSFFVSESSRHRSEAYGDVISCI